MPRLLLVDDNPSIHKIAETLLATSPIELVCVDSAAAALEKVERGDHFDVALVDTSMAGMDGWALLAKLRDLPATARMPIAMMAGVLDTVDPERVNAAPIQGFLKKPVELRELGERVLRLMETPVALPEPPPVLAAPEPPAPPQVPPSPFATMPATRLDDLPEYRQKNISATTEGDILELTEEDLFPEEQAAPLPAAPLHAAPESAPVAAEESLDLEELDLDSLRSLSVPELAAPELTASELAVAAAVPEEPAPASPFAALDGHAEPTPDAKAFPAEELDAISTLDRLPAAPLLAEVELPDLGAPTEELVDITSLSNLPEIEDLVPAGQVESPDIPLAALLEEPREEAVFTPPLPCLEGSLDWSDESESMLASVEEVPAPRIEAESVSLPAEELDLGDVSILESPAEVQTLHLEPLEAEAVAAIPVLAAAVPSMPSPGPAPESTEAIVESALRESAEAPVDEAVAGPPALPPAAGPGSRELLDAMMADPVLMDALAKAVVARLGDQTLREIAWEVIPELAERFPHN